MTAKGTHLTCDQKRALDKAKVRNHCWKMGLCRMQGLREPMAFPTSGLPESKRPKEAQVAVINRGPLGNLECAYLYI